MIDIITRAGRMAEKWDEAQKFLGLQKMEQEGPKRESFERTSGPTKFQNPFQKSDRFAQKDNC